MACALVTGGSSGIGLAFANALAARGDDLVLVARDELRLKATAEQLRTRYGVHIETMAADLTVREDVAAVAARLEDASRPIDTLINNAGFGVHVRLLDPDTTLQERAMAAMCTAVLILCGAAGRAMKARGGGEIINVSSASAWIATGNYSAIKRWVVSYTEALALELEGTGVQVSVVCPGWVKTEFHERSGSNRPKIPGWLWVDADQVATTALRDVRAGRVVSIPTTRWKIALLIAQYTPKGLVRFISRKISRSRGHR